MEQVSKRELSKVQGGFSVAAGFGLSALVVFLIGVVDGFVHPKKCSG